MIIINIVVVINIMIIIDNVDIKICGIFENNQKKIIYKNTLIMYKFIYYIHHNFIFKFLYLIYFI